MKPDATTDMEMRAEDYREAAALREGLRRFLRRSEEIAAANGLTPQRQLLLLLIKGAPDGSERATVTDLADRMQLAQNTVTDLVTFFSNNPELRFVSDEDADTVSIPTSLPARLGTPRGDLEQTVLRY